MDPEDLERRLNALEGEARRLELDAAARAAQLEAVRANAEAFLERVPGAPAYREEEAGDADASLAVGERPAPIEQALAALDRHVYASGVEIGSPRFFGYIPSGGLYTSALGDFLAAVVNRYAGVRFSGPGAVRLERLCVRWFADCVGYPRQAEGDLTSGGSIAGLSAVVAAREAAGLEAAQYSRAVVYRTALTHHSLPKALRIAGLGECVMREVALDERRRMRADALAEAVDADRAAGLRPWLVLAAAGTTDTGSVDPLADLAEVAAARGLWLHVDAAYGGAFVLCDEGRRRLAGIERADSIVLDPHKGLFLPFGSGVVLVRDGRRLVDAFRARGPYMQDFETVYAPEDLSPMDLSPELSRPFRALRLWLPLKVFGVAPFRAALEEKLLLARYAYERLAQMPGIEVGPPPDLSIVTFRYRPASGDADVLNRRVVEALRRDGRLFLSSTTIEGRFTLRLAVLNYNTHREAVDDALAVLGEYAARARAGAL